VGRSASGTLPLLLVESSCNSSLESSSQANSRCEDAGVADMPTDLSL
jgi:hypothetical protein